MRKQLELFDSSARKTEPPAETGLEIRDCVDLMDVLLEHGQDKLRKLLQRPAAFMFLDGATARSWAGGDYQSAGEKASLSLHDLMVWVAGRGRPSGLAVWWHAMDCAVYRPSDEPMVWIALSTHDNSILSRATEALRPAGFVELDLGGSAFEGGLFLNQVLFGRRLYRLSFQDSWTVSLGDLL